MLILLFDALSPTILITDHARVIYPRVYYPSITSTSKFNVLASIQAIFGSSFH